MKLLFLILIFFSTGVMAQSFEVSIKNETLPANYASGKKANWLSDHEKYEVEIFKGHILGELGQFYSIYFFFGYDTTVYHGICHWGSEKLYEKAQVNWKNDSLVNVLLTNPDTTESILLFGTRIGESGLIVQNK